MNTSPIDQKWIMNYCDSLLQLIAKLPVEENVMRDTLLRRVECVMDLLTAWQTNKQCTRFSHFCGLQVHKV